MTIIPNAAFLLKNEAPKFRRRPVTIQAFMKRDGTHHPLCPVQCLREYLSVTRQFNNRPYLFLNPITGARCDRGRIRYLIRKLIRMTQPDIYTTFHDLRKFACWKAFWSNMSPGDIRNVGFLALQLSSNTLLHSGVSSRKCTVCSLGSSLQLGLSVNFIAGWTILPLSIW